jgi:membrane protease YdiL (CAAX protease family)
MWAYCLQRRYSMMSVLNSALQPPVGLSNFFSHQSVAIKILAFFLFWGILWLPIAIPLAIFLQWQPSRPLTPGQKLPLVLLLYALVPVILWIIAQIEQVPLSAYGLVWQPALARSLVTGLLLGTVGLVILLGLQGLLGWLDGQQTLLRQFLVALLPTLFLAFLISLMEEWVFRGFLVYQIQQDHGNWIAAIAASCIFALLHLVWGWRDALPQLPGLWLMGMVLVLACWMDQGSLGLAIGLHTGWVWGIASLDTVPLVHSSDRSPQWLTGLKGQPLTGAMDLGLLLATAAVLVVAQTVK